MRLMHSPPPDGGLRRVEAARYALLRRLTLAMRDQMVAHLHPIGVATQVMERRLRQDAPDVAKVGDDMSRLRGFASTAVAVNLDVVTWLSPEDGQQVALAAGVQECVDMLRGHFGFCGFDLRAEAGGSTHVAARSAVRTVLAGVLFAIADEAPPSALVVRSAGSVIEVERTPTQAAVAASLPPYRVLPWDEVEVLARAEHVAVARTPGGARLQFGA